MNINSRISSIRQASSLDKSVTGFPSLHLSDLKITGNPTFPIPTNLRLGHMAEKVVSELIKSSSNYNVLHENIQLFEGKNTIGELDFILEEVATKKLIHVELAYKFYLCDPSISVDPVNNWIGPNRGDSLKEKLEKLKQRQLPLLHHPSATTKLDDIDISKVTQALCFLVSLYVPYDNKNQFDEVYQNAIKGYYLSLSKLKSLDHSKKAYYLPRKLQWGMNPSTNETWMPFSEVVEDISVSIVEKQSLLIWEKEEDSYSSFYVVWWN